ncbi:hypothetical protein Hypma_006479 [Hypsizygus marmoreus]|uniref:Uncharacterized protein n=1 Tax=Hypsizygus marmoreus TaxID=39966 RepID=A0A369JZP3_HYPMA|nr:hypothetical protein Hypma_006479 [Hypsizygus marmoreus]
MPRHFAKRQDPVAVPTGINGIDTTAIVVDPDANTATALAFDSTVIPGASQSAPDFGIGTTPVITTTPIATQTTPTSSPSISAASGSSSPIPLSTVVAACVGALIGAIALILLALWFYRRYAKSLKKHAVSRRTLAQPRNKQGDIGRRRSHLEPWNKLEDGDDKWEGQYQTKEVDTVAPMEKLTMFKKSPSVRTAWTHKSSEEGASFEGHPFAQYHPGLAADLASGNKVPDMPIARPFLGRVDAGQAISWDGETLGGSSLLSIHSNRLTSGAMSPTLAIPTPPPATQSQLHRWESAEVIEYEDSQASDKNPFGAGSQTLKGPGTTNPFFNAQISLPETRSRSNSTSKGSKGKGRAVDDEDPFSDANMSMPRPTFSTVTHTAQSSVSSNERALQSLIAALEVSEEEVQERLRVASMQPSFISATSAYTSGGEDDDVTGSFPLPPSVDSGHRR